MNSAPWTDIGRIQHEVADVKQQLHGKVNNHEIHALASRVDRLEHSLREARADIAGLLSRIEALENEMIQVR